jgi:hypothetical protein
MLFAAKDLIRSNYTHAYRTEKREQLTKKTTKAEEDKEKTRRDG